MVSWIRCPVQGARLTGRSRVTVAIHDFVDPRTVVLQFVVGGTPPHGRSLSGILHHIPNLRAIHRVCREQGGVGRAGGRVKIRG